MYLSFFAHISRVLLQFEINIQHLFYNLSALRNQERLHDEILVKQVSEMDEKLNEARREHMKAGEDY